MTSVSSDQPLKVGYICNTLNPGGSEMRAVAVAQNMHDQADLTIITTGPGKLDDQVSNAGVRLYTLFSPTAGILRFMKAIRRIHRQQRFDVIHVHGNRIGPFVRLALLGFAPPMVCTFHGHRIRNRWFHYLNFLVFKRILCVSKELYEYTIQRSPKWYHPRLRVLLNGVDSSRVIAGRDRGKLRKELNLDENHFLMGMVGNIGPGRNFAMICRTLPKVFEAMPQARFVFIGGVRSQKMKDELDSIIAETGTAGRIFFAGSRTDVPDLLQELDVYVYASEHDTFGLTIIEAMMAGLPIVVNNLPVFDETTDKGRCVEYFRTDDEADLARAILALAQSSERREELADEARDWALTKFDISTHIAGLLQQYHEMNAGR